MSKWQIKRIKDFAFTKSGGTPSTDRKDYWENGTIGWINSGELSKNNFIKKPTTYITEKGFRNSAATLMPIGTVVIALTGATTGMVALLEIETTGNQSITGIFPSDEYNSLYLFYYLSNNRNKILEFNTGSAQPHINKRIVDELEILFPANKSEQSKIAAVLSSIDKAIEQTEKLIEKQKRIKRGLLHDLLTKGIDENSVIRSEATHEFKDSPLGRVPKDWNVENVGSFLSRARGFVQTGPFGSQLHAHEYVTEGVPVIMPQDILGEEISMTDIAQISEEKANQLKRHKTQINDVVFSRRGDLSRIVAINEKTKHWLCGTGCLLMRVSEKYLNGNWFAHIYRWHSTQTQVEAMAVGSTMPNLNSKIISDLLVAFPSIEEQNLIAEISSDREKEIRILENQKQKQEAIKKGLMQDLLTENEELRVSNLL
jgi:type I restriction enzyme, S subunit